MMKILLVTDRTIYAIYEWISQNIGRIFTANYRTVTGHQPYFGVNEFLVKNI